MNDLFLKVAAATPDIRVADPDYNTEQIIECMQKANTEHAKLLVLPELCLTGYTCQDLFLQERLLEESLEKQKEVKGDSDVLELLAADRHMRYLLSTFCGKEHIWDYFRTLDCDMMRVNYLQYSTFNFKVYMSSLTRWEHTQVETRLLLDNIMRGDAEAASLICSNHFNAVLWNTDTLQGIYPQFFSR